MIVWYCWNLDFWILSCVIGAGVAIDQGIAYFLMLVALAITYMIHWNSKGVSFHLDKIIKFILWWIRIIWRYLLPWTIGGYILLWSSGSVLFLILPCLGLLVCVFFQFLLKLNSLGWESAAKCSTSIWTGFAVDLFIPCKCLSEVVTWKYYPISQISCILFFFHSSWIMLTLFYTPLFLLIFRGSRAHDSCDLNYDLERCLVLNVHLAFRTMIKTYNSMFRISMNVWTKPMAICDEMNFKLWSTF